MKLGLQISTKITDETQPVPGGSQTIAADLLDNVLKEFNKEMKHMKELQAKLVAFAQY